MLISLMLSNCLFTVLASSTDIIKT